MSQLHKWSFKSHKHLRSRGRRGLRTGGFGCWLIFSMSLAYNFQRRGKLIVTVSGVSYPSCHFHIRGESEKWNSLSDRSSTLHPKNLQQHCMALHFRQGDSRRGHAPQSTSRSTSLPNPLIRIARHVRNEHTHALTHPQPLQHQYLDAHWLRCWGYTSADKSGCTIDPFYGCTSDPHARVQLPILTAYNYLQLPTTTYNFNCLQFYLNYIQLPATAEILTTHNHQQPPITYTFFNPQKTIEVAKWIAPRFVPNLSEFAPRWELLLCCSNQDIIRSANWKIEPKTPFWWCLMMSDVHIICS